MPGAVASQPISMPSSGTAADAPPSSGELPPSELTTATPIHAEVATAAIDPLMAEQLKTELKEQLTKEITEQLNAEREQQQQQQLAREPMVAAVATPESDYDEDDNTREKEDDVGSKYECCGIAATKKCWLLLLAAIALVVIGAVATAVAVVSTGGEDDSSDTTVSDQSFIDRSEVTPAPSIGGNANFPTTTTVGSQAPSSLFGSSAPSMSPSANPTTSPTPKPSPFPTGAQSITFTAEFDFTVKTALLPDGGISTELSAEQVNVLEANMLEAFAVAVGRSPAYTSEELQMILVDVKSNSLRETITDTVLRQANDAVLLDVQSLNAFLSNDGSYSTLDLNKGSPTLLELFLDDLESLLSEEPLFIITLSPTEQPSNGPTPGPSRSPTPNPSPRPSLPPVMGATPSPTRSPSRLPTRQPTPALTPLPTRVPSPSPTTREPTPSPTRRRTPNPTPNPTTRAPTPNPTPSPTTRAPTPNPTRRVTPNPTPNPTRVPTPSPTSPPQEDRFDQLFDRIGSIVSSNPSVLTNGFSPQYDAMEWMTYVDSADLDFATESTFILVERYIVMVLYYSLGGDFWDRQFGFGGSSSVCDWNRVVSGLEQGILCNEEDEVTEVVFSGNGLDGTVPTEIGLLTNLNFLAMQDDFVYGSIPTEIGRLTNLGLLSFALNTMSGSLPSQLGQLPLYYLDVSSNFFTGQAPSHLENLSDTIFEAYFNDNDFSGGFENLWCDTFLDVFETDCYLICNCCTFCHGGSDDDGGFGDDDFF